MSYFVGLKPHASTGMARGSFRGFGSFRSSRSWARSEKAIMNCEWVRENVALYLYNELGDDGRHEVEQHVNRCEACAEELETMKAFHVTMTALPKLEVTPN